MIYLFVIILTTFTFVFAVTYLVVPLFGAPLLPSKKRDLENILKEFDLPKDVKMVDLGSGIGTFIKFIHKQGYSSDGVDINPFLVLITKIRLKLSGINSNVYLNNVMKHDLSSYDVVYCYLLPGLLAKLANKFETELKPGSLIICNSFKIKDWEVYKQTGRIRIYKING